MNQDWMKRTTWSQQASITRSQSDATGYKAYQEDVELPVRRRRGTGNDQPNSASSNTSVNLTDNGSISTVRKIIKSFKLTTPLFGLNYTVAETTKLQQTPAYYAVAYEFNFKQPDIVLYAGKDKDGDQLAIAHFRFSRHVRLGFGPQTLSMGHGMWEEMRNTSSWLCHGRYEFEYNVPDEGVDSSSGDAEEEEGVSRTRTRFVWERTRAELDGVRGKFERSVGNRNYRLVEQDTGRVLAVMLVGMYSGCAYNETLNIHEEISREMEAVIVLSALCIVEKAERRIRHGGLGVAASGGGP